LRLLENAHLLRYPHPSSLRRTSLYASFLGISEALHMDIFRQPLRKGEQSGDPAYGATEDGMAGRSRQKKKFNPCVNSVSRA